MALPDDILLVERTEIILGTAAAATHFGTQTDLMTLTSLGTTIARQSAKFDLGASRGQLVHVRLSATFASAATVGTTVDIYVGMSHSATAATGNPGGLSGSDATYAGYSSNLDDSLKHLIYVGSHSATAQTTTKQVSHIGSFMATKRYAMVVVDNNTNQNFGSTAANNSVALTSLNFQVQD